MLLRATLLTCVAALCLAGSSFAGKQTATSKCVTFARKFNEVAYRHRQPTRIWNSVGTMKMIPAVVGGTLPIVECKMLVHNHATNRTYCQGVSFDPQTFEVLSWTGVFSCPAFT